MSSIIGIVSCGFDRDRQFTANSYIEAISAAGGIPAVIPCFPFKPRTSTSYLSDRGSPATHPFEPFTDMCGGFLFCGGGDVTPLLFGEEPETDRGETDLRTDLFQIALMHFILSRRKPVLGICRGMQVLNLACGGSIFQDISLRPGHSLNHMSLSLDRSDASHRITVKKGSLLYKICGNLYAVNSFHHQCVKDPGRDLTVSATASDGIIEAIESVSLPFALGVQWHPECMRRFDPRMEKIFSSFVNISRRGHLPL